MLRTVYCTEYRRFTFKKVETKYVGSKKGLVQYYKSIQNIRNIFLYSGNKKSLTHTGKVGKPGGYEVQLADQISKH